MTLIRSLPTIVGSFRDSLRDLRAGEKGAAGKLRTERDLPLSIVVGGCIALVAIIALLPTLPGTFPGSLLTGLLVVVFGFFFVTVSSAIVGIISSSSNPISRTTIATLMRRTSSSSRSSGRRGRLQYDRSPRRRGRVHRGGQRGGDVRAGPSRRATLVGATPIRQQIALLIGVVVSIAVIGGTVLLLDRSVPGEIHGIGSARMPAPQGTLMATIIKGMLAQKLPWGPVLIGVFAAFVAQLAGAHALSWAVGAYLPVSTTAPIWVGGLTCERSRTRSPSGKKRERSGRGCSTRRGS